MAILANELRLRRGTEEQHKTFIGSLGEVTVVTTEDSSKDSPGKYILSVHDGKTAGGHYLAGKNYVDSELINIRTRFNQIDNRLKDEYLSKQDAENTYMRIDASFNENNLPSGLKEYFSKLSSDIAYFKDFEEQLKQHESKIDSGATHIGYAASEEFFDLRDESTLNPDLENGYPTPTIIDVQAAIDAIASWYKVLATRIDDGVLDEKINNAINKLIDGAPEALDTLKELAELLGDNKDFTGTIIGRLDLMQRGTVKLNSKNGIKVDFVGKLGKFIGKNYSVSVTPVFKGFNEDGSIINEGTIGEIWIQKNKDSFVIYNTGPAVDIEADFIIIGEVGE